MPVGHDFLRYKGGIPFGSGADPEHQVDALGDVIDVAVGYENLDTNVWIGRMECADQWLKHRVRDARRCRKPQQAGDVRQAVRNDVVDRLTDLDAAAGLLEDFGSDIGEPQVACRSLQQTHAELILKFGNTPTH